MAKASRGHSLAAILVLLPAVMSQPQTTANPVLVSVPSPLSVEILPALDMPIADAARYFSLGGAVDFGLRYRFAPSIFALLGGVEYGYVPTRGLSSLSVVTPRLGAGIQVPVGSVFSIFANVFGGYYFATKNDLTLGVGDPYVAGGLGLRIALAPTFNLEVGGLYKYYAGLYQGVSVAVGVDIAAGNIGGRIDILSVQLQPAFPVFYKHYDDHPIGTVEVKSNLRVPATDVTAQVYIQEFMDAPKLVSVCARLAPGETVATDLYALFTDKVLGITEGTKVAAEITVAFRVEGRSYEDRRIYTLSVLGRNAMTWDDNSKAAAFVTSKEPQVLDFARSVTSYVRSKETRSVCDNLQAAIALHEALDLYGVNYTPNPVTPYSQASRAKGAIDFLQFPRETFQYRAGDCSDLSILYGALLQAVGIDAAFVTIPGHIYVAVDTCVPVEKTSQWLIPAGSFIAYGGKVWIPVEITLRGQGFMKAWQLGAKEWTENVMSGQAGFYPIQNAWKTYQPVGLPGTETKICIPPSDTILSAYLREVQRYISRELAPQIARLQEEATSTGEVAPLNSLGVLYAKYGQMDKAEEAFKKVLSNEPYFPSLLNLGNLYYLREDWSAALKCYREADHLVPDNPRVILAQAKVAREMQDYADLRILYERLTLIDHRLATEYAYLVETKHSGKRAGVVASERRAVLWEGEELKP
jgi:tetratricopeptide (TPR) repeat protein